MLRKLMVQGFKSLVDVTIELPRLAVLVGPNSAGKSNLLDAIQTLSWIGNARTLFDALGHPFPVRGHAFEAFSLPPDGIPGLVTGGSARFTIAADLETADARFRYSVSPEMVFPSGELRVADEYLVKTGAKGSPVGAAAIERNDGEIRIRRQGGPGRPRQERVGLNHSVLSDRSLAGPDYPWLEAVRNELADWRAYYFEPRDGMRHEQPPSDLPDIGLRGEYLAPFLYKLRATAPKHFRSFELTLRTLVPSLDGLSIELDERRGLVELRVRQAGVEYSSRVVSEGTLRVLALCAVAVNPWAGSLVALEEPENGVDPRRLELIAELLLSLAGHPRRQVVVTTHSPMFCDAIIKAGELRPGLLQLFNVTSHGRGTVVETIDYTSPLFRDAEIASALGASTDGMFQKLLTRGYIGE